MGNLTRTVIDTTVGYTSVALPAQNTTANSGIIDLQQAPSLLAGNGTSVTEEIQISASLPALPSLANGQTMTATLEDSADGVTFANVAAYAEPILTATGAGGVGSPVASVTLPLPLTIRRYLMVVWTASATAGNNTALNGQFNLVF